MVLSAQQRVLWEYETQRKERLIESVNGIGPFFLDARSNLVPRFFGCPNYDSCLGYSAKNMWPSFSCEGCRKTAGKQSVEERFS